MPRISMCQVFHPSALCPAAAEASALSMVPVSGPKKYASCMRASLTFPSTSSTYASGARTTWRLIFFAGSMFVRMLTLPFFSTCRMTSLSGASDM